MYVLCVLNIPESVAADAVFKAVSDGVPVRRRLRHATEHVIRERGRAVQVIYAALARQDRAFLKWRIENRGRK